MFAYLFLTITAAFCGYFIYKIIELYATRQERQTIIERLDSEGLKEYLKYMQARTSLRKVVNNELVLACIYFKYSFKPSESRRSIIV